MDRAGIWQIIIEERLGIRDLLRSLTPAQWDEPSRCDGWRVRDVAAHLIANPQLDVAATLRFVGGMWRGYDTAVRLDGVRRGSAPVEQILDQWDRFAEVRRHPFVTSIREPLIDVLVHQQDIARPLGIRRDLNPAAVGEAIDRARLMAVAMGGGRLVRSVRMVATDADWQAGRGPEIRGPIGELLMLTCGRTATPGSVEGPGIAEPA